MTMVTLDLGMKETWGWMSGQSGSPALLSLLGSPLVGRRGKGRTLLLHNPAAPSFRVKGTVPTRALRL